MKRGHTTRKNKEEFSAAAKVLLYFFTFADLIPRPFESKTRYTNRLFSGKIDTSTIRLCYKVMERLEEKGWLKVSKDPKDKRKNLYVLTEQGRLEALFIKAQMHTQTDWDGKWRIVFFDIPEDARAERNKLRYLLKTNGFKQLQKSVFINPYPFNKEAVEYLKQTELVKYIRIFRVDEPDDEEMLKKMFDIK
ncbi:MAG: CRISPR-associated endonuclease Cas2 [Patescibacteria group bacterium]|nr:CRISPR-associated endonuclease Cas2 [Patescibacteria group bacterium]